MALELEIWHESIQENLFKDNGFLRAISDVSSDNIIGGKIVHIPQAGDPSAVEKNRSSVPATPAKRVDTEVLYKIDEYTTDPVYIPNAENVELSYNKRQSVLDNDLGNLSETIAENMLHNFVKSPVGDNQEIPSEHILSTEGDNVSAGLAGATGNRKAYTLKDLQRLKARLIKQNAWREGKMNVLLTADAAVQMFPVDSAITATYMAAVTEKEQREGIVYKVQGFNVYVRSSAYVIDEAGEIKAPGSVVEETDTEAIVAWNTNMLEKAVGNTKIFETLNDPTYYGDIYSFLVRMGGRAKRKNYEGILLLKQAATS